MQVPSASCSVRPQAGSYITTDRQADRETVKQMRGLGTSGPYKPTIVLLALVRFEADIAWPHFSHLCDRVTHGEVDLFSIQGSQQARKGSAVICSVKGEGKLLKQLPTLSRRSF